MKNIQKASLRFLCVVALLVSFPSGGHSEDLTVAQLIQQHLNSIGDLESPEVAPARSLTGAGEFRMVVGGTGSLHGAVALLSQGHKLYFSVDFDYPQYPGEKIGYDGKKARVQYINPSGRSPLGNFLHTYNLIVKEGLLGGSLSTCWPLLDLTGRRPKLKYRGLRKIGDKKLHRLSYQPRRGGRNIKVNLYFEQETFHHVRTEYIVTLRRGMRTSRNLATPTEDAGREDEFQLIETFDTFRNLEGLTLPTRWSLRYSESKRGGASGLGGPGLVVEYDFWIENITYGEEVNPKVFAVSEKPESLRQ